MSHTSAIALDRFLENLVRNAGGRVTRERMRIGEHPESVFKVTLELANTVYAGYSLGNDELGGDIAVFECVERLLVDFYARQEFSPYGGGSLRGMTGLRRYEPARSSQGSDKTVPAIDFSTRRRKTVNHELAFVLHSTGSGCSIHTASHKARMGAVLELIERHVTLTHWLCDAPFPFRLASDDPICAQRVKFAEDAGYCLEVHGAAFGQRLPVAVAVMRSIDASQYPAVVVGAAAALNWNIAYEKASRECFMVWAMERSLSSDAGRRSSHPDDRARLLVQADASRVSRVFGRGETRALHELGDAVDEDALLRLLLPLDISLIDLSNPQIEGIFMFRAVSPSLQPLYFGTPRAVLKVIQDASLEKNRVHPF